MSLTTRVATAADAGAVAALVQSAYRGESSRAGWTTEADLLDGQRADAAMVTDLVAAPGSLVLLGLEGPQVVACCHLERRGTHAYLGMFAVTPARQGGGLGRSMLDAAGTLVRERWSAGVLEITVLEQRTELIDWYRRRGFVPDGTVHPFPYGDERYGVPRRPDLRLVGMVAPVPGVSPCEVGPGG
ncbi:GNAT family N-acetyltransferase [Cellulomonas bogoriensis]|uniref:GCN5 family acetyltransferase n=1 Tax=Cellulomonas bogoriensis 69B4 = DSM 16987 TaxID=1386082 RepID=A0A0A0BZ41_9CELL|nr:GNAT family N-acetyltransferase [Cellulomonas bogoriensis]KGM12972.1 GCN5 family acetyltransferase [Cellulomonas bogoriensis 69B4 = DSM 16987]